MGLSKCRLCGGKVEKHNVNVENWWGDTLTIVEDVPAWVCADCGEQYFDADTSIELDKMRSKAPSKPKRILQVPVYQYKAK